ncbi:MAG: 30S ribosomal protein S4 [Candidatus Gracilibacteria bacterium]|nr:30S ribosomal protein S4 [Candidatus Gracilibacteria bacterium]
MRYTGPKMKLCRREGYNLFGTEKYNLENNHRRVKRAGKMSEFGVQLRKKQAAKRQFALSEKQFARYYSRAVKTNEVTGDAMLRLLETRLDTVILRANFARTIMQARQCVSHAHFLVNGKKLNIPSYEVRVGDVITIKERMKESALYKSLVEEFQAFASKNAAAQVTSAKWLTVDPKKLSITITALPEKGDFDQMIDVQRIIEFYSK